MASIPQGYVSRQAEILAHFQQVVESHIDDLLAGRVEQLAELQEIAAVLGLHPVHLSKVVKLASGQHACHFYQQKIVLETKKLLADTTLPISEIARKLDYDVSNFTKFFKRFTGLTPSAYRKAEEVSPA